MRVLKDARKALIGIVLLVATIVVGYSALPREDYTVKIVMDNAEGLANGARVWMDGFDAGWVENIATKDGKAILTVGITPGRAPLHTGSSVRVQWYAALGERILTVYPGPAGNPEIPNGGMIVAPTQQVEVDEVLAALDEPTRQKLDGLIDSLRTLQAGKEQDFRTTQQTAGPAVQAAGAIFDAIGRDGPAIHTFVGQMQRLLAVAATQQQDLSGTIGNLNGFAGHVATTQRQLSDVLNQLPPTLREANATLHDVPPAVDKANDLLDKLRPGTNALPDVARDLNPALHDLRPTVRDLRPTIEYLRDFLDYARSARLLDQAHIALPKAAYFVKSYQPAISFLRPYTPELQGWLQNWGKNFGAYDSQGHLWAAILGEGSPQALDESPVKVPPVERAGTPPPGAPIGQPWHDRTLDASGEGEH